MAGNHSASLAQEPAGELHGEPQPSQPMVDEPFGAWQATLPGLAEPGAVAIGPDGVIYVAESGADRVRVLDLEGRELMTFGSSGSGPGELLDPRGLAVDATGRVFVSDCGNHRICVFGSDGRFERSFGRLGEGPGELNGPRGLALWDGELAVADARNHRVQMFRADGSPGEAVGGFGREPGRFNRPLDVAFTATGELLVADADNHRIQKLSRDGAVLSSWGDFGPYPGFFVQPTGIDCEAGLVYVADRDNHRVQVFDEAGVLQYEWGVHALRPREAGGKLHYPDQVAVSGTFVVLAESFENRCQLFRRVEPGMPPNGDMLRFERDTSAHYGPNLSVAGHLLALCEPSTPSLWLDDLTSGEPIQVTQLRRPGTGFGALLRPEDAAIDLERSLVHLADPGNRRLSTYTLHQSGGALRYDPQMLRLQRGVDLDLLHVLSQTGLRWPIDPSSLEVGPEGDLYVCDAANRVVVVLSRDFAVLRSFTGGIHGFLRPVQTAFSRDGKVLLVVDELDARVRRFEREEPWRELPPVGSRGSGDGQLLRPFGVTVDGKGAILVSDAQRHDVQRFDAQGRFLGRLGGEGVEHGQLYKPKALSWSPDGAEGGLLYVLDYGNHRAQAFEADGSHVLTFGARLYARPPSRPAPEGSR